MKRSACHALDDVTAGDSGSPRIRKPRAWLVARRVPFALDPEDNSDEGATMLAALLAAGASDADCAPNVLVDLQAPPARTPASAVAETEGETTLVQRASPNDEAANTPPAHASLDAPVAVVEHHHEANATLLLQRMEAPETTEEQSAPCWSGVAHRGQEQVHVVNASAVAVAKRARGKGAKTRGSVQTGAPVAAALGWSGGKKDSQYVVPAALLEQAVVEPLSNGLDAAVAEQWRSRRTTEQPVPPAAPTWISTTAQRHTKRPEHLKRLEAENEKLQRRVEQLLQSAADFRRRADREHQDMLLALRARDDHIQALRAELRLLGRGPVSDALAASQMQAMVAALEREHGSGNHAVLVHCLRGIAGDPAFAALVALLDRMLESDPHIPLVQ